MHGLNELVLEPKEEWEWLPGEDWYVDRSGEWAGGEGEWGVDVGEFDSSFSRNKSSSDASLSSLTRIISDSPFAEGWSYLNSHHQASPTPYKSVSPVGPTGEDVEVGTVRRRRWWRRGVKVVD